MTARAARAVVSLTDRLARTWDRNPRHRCGPRCAERTRKLNEKGRPGPHHYAPGSARRAKQEYRLADARTWWRALLRGELLDLGRGALTYSRALAIAQQARAVLGRFGPSAARIEQLVQLITATGPGQGWAFTDQRARGPRGSLFVRLYLPRRSEPAARAWLRLVRELRALLARVAQLASKVSPALRTSPDAARRETVWKGSPSAGGAWQAVAGRIAARAGFDGAM